MNIDIDNKCINTLRVLACDMIENANSGHPGIVLGASPVMYTLYGKIMNISAHQPTHFMRDRFVLSAGHGSAMLYSTLHLFGYDWSINDLKNFRQLNSKTHGHPEVNVTLGVESTTGPLGQGVANAVGMAIAQSHLASIFNKRDIKLIDNYTYALVGDGCLMEGVANEALSLAGTLQLNKLIVLYDFNKITIDGKTDLTFKQNTKTVFKGYGFNVFEVKDANDTLEIERAIKKAKRGNKPALIIVNSVIGYGSSLAGTSKVHGAPLGNEIFLKLKNNLGITSQPFEIDADARLHFKFLQQRYNLVENAWNEKLLKYKTNYPNEYKLLQTYLSSDFKSLDKILAKLPSKNSPMSTRDIGGEVLSYLAEKYPYIIGGTADLSSSTKTIIKTSGKYQPSTRNGRNIMFGVREFGMGAIANGISLYGGLIPFVSTFFVFSDYMRASIRMSALMNRKVMYIFTHDSIGVGEDGPTHQSIEHLNSFRIMPNVTLFRPANFEEVKASYYFALNNNNPTIITLTRQKVLNQEGSFQGALQGAYIINKERSNPQAILIATGSEVELAQQAQNYLWQKNVDVRVVSMPSMEVFLKQEKKYINQVLPKGVIRVSIEAGNTDLWKKIVGDSGVSIGIDTFGKSGKDIDLFKYFGLTVENIVKSVEKTLKNR